MKRLFLLIICGLIILGLGAVSVASQDIDIYVNDNKIYTDVAPQIKQGRVMVPLRLVAEALGADVNWDDKNESVRVAIEGTLVQVNMDGRAFKNNMPLDMDVSPQLLQGRVMVPLRFISEALGYEVSWDGNNRRVTIKQGGGIAIGYKIYYYTKGKREQIHSKDADMLQNAVSSCLEQTVDRLRLHVDTERVNRIYTESEVLEFVYQFPIKKKLGPYGEYELKKVLIPLSGDFAVPEDSKIITVLTESSTGGWNAWSCSVNSASIFKQK